MHLDLEKLWTAAGVLAGLQVTGFTLRINREIEMGGKGDLTWLPLADTLNLVSLAVTMLGVFLAPILGISGASAALKAFGLSVLLLAGYPFALASHYEMFNPRTRRTMTYCPRQERIVLSMVAVAVVAYVVLASTR
ncbi:hypothetical protein [Streptomyces sp. NPDC096033]|uniref:hypothetical protein n=1 Tax=Streptomyces sp. NPDC096033 TaxID=3366071 RepID=UPI00381CE0E0